MRTLAPWDRFVGVCVDTSYVLATSLWHYIIIVLHNGNILIKSQSEKEQRANQTTTTI